MRRALLAVVVSLLLAPLGALTACGGGGSGGGGDPEGARAALIDVLDAARKDDFNGVRGRLDVIEFLGSMEHPGARTYPDLPKAEQEELAQNCYRGVTGVMRVLKLPDQPSIAAAVKSGTIENFPQLKAVNIHFQAPDAEREGRQLAVDAKLRYGIDRVWRLASLQADL